MGHFVVIDLRLLLKGKGMVTKWVCILTKALGEQPTGQEGNKPLAIVSDGPFLGAVCPTSGYALGSANKV